MQAKNVVAFTVW